MQWIALWNNTATDVGWQEAMVRKWIGGRYLMARAWEAQGKSTMVLPGQAASRSWGGKHICMRWIFSILHGQHGQSNVAAAGMDNAGMDDKAMWLLSVGQHGQLWLDCIRPSALKSACDPAKPRTWCFWAIPGHSRMASRPVFHSGKFECSATWYSTTTPYDSYLLRLPPSHSLWLPTTP